VSDEAASAPSPPRRSRRRHAVLRRALRMAGTAREAADAAVALLLAEAALCRAAWPHLFFWLGLSLVLAFSLFASLWTLAALGLQSWLGSLPAALGLLGAGSAALLAAALWQARRVLRWASFPESRRRAGDGLRALRRGGGTDAR